jgi:hypothetical protein
MECSFDIEIAKKYSVDMAILYKFMLSNKRYQYQLVEGFLIKTKGVACCVIYSVIRQALPFWTEQKLKKIINNMMNRGIITYVNKGRFDLLLVFTPIEKL